MNNDGPKFYLGLNAGYGTGKYVYKTVTKKNFRYNFVAPHLGMEDYFSDSNKSILYGVSVDLKSLFFRDYDQPPEAIKEKDFYFIPQLYIYVGMGF